MREYHESINTTIHKHLPMRHGNFQAINQLIKYHIDQLQHERSTLKFDIAYNWEKCDPEKPETGEYFRELNMLRDRLRSVEKKLKKFRQHHLLFTTAMKIMVRP